MSRRWSSIGWIGAIGHARVQIAGGKTLPDNVIAQIVERTDGVPLFIEELTKSVLESGVRRLRDPYEPA